MKYKIQNTDIQSFPPLLPAGAKDFFEKIAKHCLRFSSANYTIVTIVTIPFCGQGLACSPTTLLQNHMKPFPNMSLIVSIVPNKCWFSSTTKRE